MSVQTSPLDPRFIALLLDSLLKVLTGETDQDNAARREIARILFAAFKPADAIEATLAVRAVAAHFAAMEDFARAARPDTSDEKALRLHGRALAAGRSFDTAVRILDKRHKAPPQAATQATAAKRALAPAAKPTPVAPRLGFPIEIPCLPKSNKPPSLRAECYASSALTSRLLEIGVAGGPLAR